MTGRAIAYWVIPPEQNAEYVAAMTDLGSTYTFTDMVNAYVSCGWDFREIIAPKVISYVYDRMMIQALFYQASLRHYDQGITTRTQNLLDDSKSIEAIRKHREEFIQFTNQYWFRELTNQMQGKEIFRLALMLPFDSSCFNRVKAIFLNKEKF